MGNYNDFDLDIKKVQGENDIGPASITTTIILLVILIIVLKQIVNNLYLKPFPTLQSWILLFQCFL